MGRKTRKLYSDVCATPRHMRAFEQAMIGDSVRTNRGLWTLCNEHRLTPWAETEEDVAILVRMMQGFGHTVMQGGTIFAGRRKTGAFCAAIYISPDALHYRKLSAWGNGYRHESSVTSWGQRWNEWQADSTSRP